MCLVKQSYAAIFALMILFAASTVRAPGQTVKPETGPHIYLQEAQALSASFVGPQNATQILGSGQAQPLSMAAGDFNEDGIQDLAAGYAAPSGGIVALYQGNLDAFAPQSLASWSAIGASQFPPPLVSSVNAFLIPKPPDFLVSGEFLGRGHFGLVAAARGDGTLYFFAGDGHGQFASPQAISLPAMQTVTALGAGRVGSENAFSYLLVGVNGAPGGPPPGILLYLGSEAGLSLITSFPLQAPATAFVFGDLNGDSLPDVAMISGGKVLVLYATPTMPQLKQIVLPFAATAVALGSFVHDRDPHLQLAILSPDGSVHIVAHHGFDARGWNPVDLLALRQSRLRRAPNPFGHTVYAPGEEGWQEIELLPPAALSGNTGQLPLLLRTRISDHSADDLIVFNVAAGELRVISHGNVPAGATAFIPGRQSARAYSAGTPVAALPMHVNAEARLGVVVLHQGQMAPSTMAPLPDPTFTVNTTNDTVDAHLGDGICADNQGQCSLRAAVMEANATAGSDTIMIPAGVYTLAIPGIDGSDASTGHLDIVDGITIIGADPSTTIIQAGTNLNSKGIPNGIDKVFSINPSGSFPGFDTNLSNLTIRYGLNTSTQNPFGGAFDWDAGTDGTGTIKIVGCNVKNNAAVITDGSSTSTADGGGISFTSEFPGAGQTGSIIISNTSIQSNFAQDAGGGVFLGGLPLTMSNAQILNNQAVDNPSAQGIGQSGGEQVGGGVFVAGPRVGQTTIQNSNVSGNQAGAQGGGIYTNAGLLIEQDTISQNQAGQSGGGLFSNVTGDGTSVIATTITANTSAGNGGGIEVGNRTDGNNFSIRFSRIVGNSAAAGSGLNNIAGTVSATDNWWGCNQGPGVAPCNGINNSGTTTFSPWLTFQVAANPIIIIANSATTLTAGFLQDSGGATFSADKLAAFIGLPVTFQNAVNGTLSNPQPVIQLSGTASATFTGTIVGMGRADAVANSATVTAAVTIKDSPGDFSLTSATLPQTVQAGGIATYTLTVTPLNGFTGIVIFSNVSGLPAGATANFNPPSISTSGTSILTITTSNATPAGSFSPSITSLNGSKVRATGVNLDVQNFALSVTSSTQALTPGNSVASTATVSAQNGFAGIVSFSVSGLPGGASATFSPSSISGSGSSVLTVFTSGATPGGIYVLAVTATSGALSHTYTVALGMVGFSLSVAPSSRTISQGTNASYQVTLTSSFGFNGPVTLSVSGLPPGAAFSPGSISAPGSFSLTVFTSSMTPPGPAELTIIASSGSMTSSTTATLLVTSTPPPVINNLSPDRVLAQGPAFNVTINGSNFPNNSVVRINGIARPTTFINASQLIATVPPSDIAASGFPSIGVFIPANGDYSDTVSLTVFRYGDLNFDNILNVTDLLVLAKYVSGNITSLDTLAADVYQDGSIDDADLKTLANYLAGNIHVLPVVPTGDFSISVTPASQTIRPGDKATYTILTADSDGFIGSVRLSISGLPSGATASFIPPVIDGSGSSTLTIAAAGSIGTYSLAITGVSGLLTHAVAANLGVSVPQDLQLPSGDCRSGTLSGTDVFCPTQQTAK